MNPQWLDPKIWKEYLVMRNKIKKPMTNYAEQLAIDKLGRLKDRGEDPTEVLNQSIQNSWQGLFPVKDQSVTERLAQAQGVPAQTLNRTPIYNDNWNSAPCDMEMVTEGKKLMLDIQARRLTTDEIVARVQRMDKCWPNAGWGEKLGEFKALAGKKVEAGV